MEDKPSDQNYFQLAFEKRPAEELYVLADDPYNLKNEVQNPKYKDVLQNLRKELNTWMKETSDLRATEPRTIYWDTVLFTSDYNYSNFDLDKKIKKYQMAIQDGGKYKEIPCIE